MPAVDGWLCKACSSKLRRWLESIEDDTLTLNLRIPDNYGWDHGHTHAKVSGSPALIRLDVLALVDPRTQGKTSTEETGQYEENQSEIINIWTTIEVHAQTLKDTYDLKSEPTLSMLITQWERLVEQDWIDEFYDDIATIRRLLNQAINKRPPLPRGRCFTCNTQLWQEDGNGEDSVTCPKCERVYDHLGLVKLELQKKREEWNPPGDRQRYAHRTQTGT